MSPARFSSELRRRLVQLHWRQWCALGVQGQVEPEDCYPIDLEALAASTRALAGHDRRLSLVAREWLAVNDAWVNQSRMARIEREFAEAGVALEEPRTGPNKTRSVAGPELQQRALVQLQLRALLGVDARAEIMLYLRLRGAGSASAIARAIRVDQKAAYRSLQRWAAAGIVVDSGEGWMLAEQWRHLPIAAFSGRFQYVDWVSTFILLARVATSSERNRYLAASEFRDIYVDARRVAVAVGLQAPNPRAYPGERYFDTFADFMLDLLQTLLGQS